MSRKLEIDDYCKSQGFEELRYGIKSIEECIARKAIEWADETMMQKAHEWFEYNMFDYIQGDIMHVDYKRMKEDFFTGIKE